MNIARFSIQRLGAFEVRFMKLQRLCVYSFDQCPPGSCRHKPGIMVDTKKDCQHFTLTIAGHDLLLMVISLSCVSASPLGSVSLNA